MKTLQLHPEQGPNESEQSPEYELWRLASEADRSLKAALFSVGLKREGKFPTQEEVWHDARRAAKDQYALFSYLRSGKWEIPPRQDDLDSERAYLSNEVAIVADWLTQSDTVRQLEARLHMEDLGTPQEPVLIDKYISWLSEPPAPDNKRGDNEAERVLWYIQLLARGYSHQFEE